MENRDNESFQYTYSAKQQAEIKAIRQKYTAKAEEEDKLTKLRRLDNKVTQKATALSLAMGIIGALIMGFGLSLVMSTLPKALGLSGLTAMVIGIVLGIAGIVCVCLAYPLYNRTLHKEREKIAPEIIALTNDLIQ